VLTLGPGQRLGLFRQHWQHRLKLGQRGHDDLLRCQIRRRQGRSVCLGLHREVAVIDRQDGFAGGTGNLTNLSGKRGNRTHAR